MIDMNYALQTTGLTKYFGEQCVVDTLNLKVPTGSVYGFLGRNGAGKSTTIKMLTGLLHPDRGSAHVLGEDAESISPQTRARIAYIAEGHPLYGYMTVAQMTAFTRSFYATWNQDLLEQILDHFELPQKARIRRLSNGQRAQVSLALAVATDPELLILDDPTLGLDTVVRRDFLESLIQIIQRKGRTIFFSSHILSEVERVGILVDGVLRVDCPTDHFKQSVRKVVLTGADPAKSQFAECPGLVSRRVVGEQLELVIAGYGESHQKLAEAAAPRSIDVLELNLEDAFIEYTRGQRRSIPLFGEGPRNE
ncbi:MAG: ABC transporter [Planctomycetaceae bacterium]|nr:ABC transporter [Planctomycetaceae bacterium]